MSRPRRFDWLFRPQLADEDLPLSAEARFAEALAELPAVERSVLALSEIGGLDTLEIADRLGTDPVVVRKLLARARESVRTSLETRGRRGITALIPFQSWWQTGSSAPVVRATGAVAAAVVGTGVAIGGASAEAPRAVLAAADPPAAHVIAKPPRDRPLAPGASTAQGRAAAALSATPKATLKSTRAAARKLPAQRPDAGTAPPGREPALQPAQFSPVATAVPSSDATPAARDEPRPAPDSAPAPSSPVPSSPAETVAVTVPLPIPPAPIVPVPVETPAPPPLPPLPVEPPALPLLPVPPPLP